MLDFIHEYISQREMYEQGLRLSLCMIQVRLRLYFLPDRGV